MKRKILKILSLLSALLLICPAATAFAEETIADDAVMQIDNLMPFDVDCLSAVLMDAQTGTVLYAKNPDEALPPASVTKVMTLLLVMEALDDGRLKLEDTLTVSEYAASMGGSQVYLEPGEQMSVNDLIKSVVVSSANDAAVTLAEALGGSEAGFITMMNERAKALGMNNTNFENPTGLDDTTVNHVISARDIAIASKELLSHPLITQYSTIWMDTIRNGAFGLSNTNRLIRFYSGATGLKTGSTSKAKFCISATACREGLHLIAVIMGAPTRDIRNEMAKTLLDYGFANYSLYTSQKENGENIKVLGGEKQSCATEISGFSVLLKRGEAAKVTRVVEAEESVPAPVKAGDPVGTVKYMLGDSIVGEGQLVASENVEKISFKGLFVRMLSAFSLT